MIKTIPIDLCLNFIFGMLFALAAGKVVRQAESVWLNRSFLAAILYACFIFAPIGVYLYFGYRDWSLMYLMKLEGSGLGLGVAAMIGYCLAMAAGNLAAQTLLRAERNATLYILLGAVVFLLMIIQGWGLKRLAYVGSYDEFWGGSAALIYKSPLGMDMAVIGIISIGGLLITLKKLYQRQNIP